MEHYVRPDGADEPPAPVAGPAEPLHRRLGRWLSGLMADRESKGQSSDLIRNSNGDGGTVVSSHGGGW
jgi:hypothetical protein